MCLRKGIMWWQTFLFAAKKKKLLSLGILMQIVYVLSLASILSKHKGRKTDWLTLVGQSGTQS